MGLFDKLFGRKKTVAPSAGEMARERLTLMLVHDRLKLTPDLLDRIKEELLAVISKYVEIDESGVDVELTHSEHSDKLVARMPVRRQRLQFQRDVLEPGMGNPLAAAAALAEIHQPPASAAAAPAEASPASGSPEPTADSPQPAAESASPEPTNAAPKPAAEVTAQPSEEGQAAQEVKEESEPKAAEASSTPAQDEAKPESAASAAETAPADAPPAENMAPEASASATDAADAVSAPDVPASATTPTKG